MTVPTADELLFLALGGAGEIGMNLNLYGHAGKWLMVDLGIAFGDDSMVSSTPGASTPPMKLPCLSAMSKVVALPKSTVISGPPYFV